MPERVLDLQVSRDATERLDRSVNRLRDAAPHLSAADGVLVRQKVGILAVLAGVIAAVVLFPIGAVQVLIDLVTVLYAAIVGERIVLLLRVAQSTPMIEITLEEALEYPDELLPWYTVLVPVFKEPEVLEALLESLDQMEYPRDRLQILLLLEESDPATIARVRELSLPESITPVVVPVGVPQTKPRALEYGLEYATGEIVTVYDAEDHPDRLQLRRAAIALARGDDRLACVQARLRYHNADQNLITRWFTLEYDTWFSYYLPGLALRGSVIPLGGTSNHFRRAALQAVGGWDPYNVTEDADLGVRLHRYGFDVGILDSVTYEEANSDFVNWMKQRSRWYKGYFITWLVHLRRPRDLYRHLGLRGFAEFNLFIGGTPILALINPIAWTSALVYFALEPPVFNKWFSGPLYYVGILLWAGGNFALLFVNVLAALKREQKGMIRAALLMPLYWVMMSLSAVKATWQLVFAPNHWEKTMHGLATSDPSKPVA